MPADSWPCYIAHFQIGDYTPPLNEKWRRQLGSGEVPQKRIVVNVAEEPFNIYFLNLPPDILGGSDFWGEESRKSTQFIWQVSQQAINKL